MVVSLAAAPAMPSSALAQDAETEARALFVSGREAAEAGLWSEAVARFSRSYELFPTASALYNLAVAMRSLGRHIEARDALARLLSDHADELDEARTREARELLAAESLRTARLALTGLPDATRFEVLLDGAAREDTGERPLELELDPGDHRLLVRDDAYEPFSWEGRLLEGQRLRLDVSLEPVQARTETVTDGSVLSSPWLWVAVGAVVLGGAALASWLLFFDVDRVEPLSDRRYRL